MKIQGEHFLQASRDRVWAAVVDPKALSSSLPGLQRLDTIGDHEYEGALEIKVGDVLGDFQGTLKLSDLNPPSSYRFSLSGMGAAGFFDGDGVLVLEESGAGTRIHYDLDAKVGGRIGGAGPRALDSSAKALARQALAGLKQRFPPPAQVKVVTKQEVAPSSAKLPAEPRPPASPPAETVPAGASGTKPVPPVAPPVPAPAPKPAPKPVSATAATPPSPAPAQRPRYGSQNAKGLADQLIPPAKRTWVFGAALILYTLVVILLTRACSS